MAIQLSLLLTLLATLSLASFPSSPPTTAPSPTTSCSAYIAPTDRGTCFGRHCGPQNFSPNQTPTHCVAGPALSTSTTTSSAVETSHTTAAAVVRRAKRQLIVPPIFCPLGVYCWPVDIPTRHFRPAATVSASTSAGLAVPFAVGTLEKRPDKRDLDRLRPKTMTTIIKPIKTVPWPTVTGAASQ